MASPAPPSPCRSTSAEPGVRMVTDFVCRFGGPDDAGFMPVC